MNDTLLISEQTLKNDSLIGDNVESVLILPAIVIAQEQGLQPAIGTKLIRKLQALGDDGTITSNTNAAYKSLLDDYITTYLEYMVMAEIQIPLSYKMRTNGVVKNSDDKTISVDLKDVMFIKTYYENKATFFLNRLTDYLCANRMIYPEYKSTDTTADMQADSKAYYSGIKLGSKKKLN
jgi:hypothetical protein